MSRGRALIAAAIVAAVAGLVGVVVATSGESCESWQQRYTAAVRAHTAAAQHGTDAELLDTLDAKLAVHDDKPKGCNR